jgi:anti-sigma factor RsiW
MTDEWTDRLSEYLDDSLIESDRSRLEAHLAGCAECSDLLEQLKSVKTRAASLEDRPPEADLWLGVAERIRDARPSRPGVVDLGERRTKQSRRLQFTLPQLIAAGVALVVVSASSVWFARPSSSPLSFPSPAAIVDSATAIAVLAGFEIGEYDAAVEDLERILYEARGRLDPGTVAALEQSLATIDRAIEEAYQALSSDPTDGYLNAHLAASMKRKIKLLQQAAEITTAAS